MNFIIFLLALLNIHLISAIDFPWMYYLPYGEDVTLKPLFKNNTENIIIKTCKWTTPKQIDLFPDFQSYDVNRYYIDRFNCELTIFNNQKDTNGIYHCAINDFYISKAMLNVHGAPKNSLLEEYTPNLIAGFSTAGGIIAFFAFTCAVYKFRYKQLDKRDDRNNGNSSSKYNRTFKNESYEVDEDKIDSESTKGSIRF